MKLLFLDFDGVLNSDVYMKSKAYQDEVAGLSDWEVIQQAHHTHLDPDALALIAKIVDATGAVVIASTTWRLRYSNDEMNLMLSNRGAKFRISGSTPAIRMFGSDRGAEIKRYMENSLDEPESFVIIDDIDFFIHYKDLYPHFIQTDSKYGIRQSDVERAIKILNGE